MMFGDESTVDRDYDRYLGPIRCLICDAMIEGPHDFRACETEAMLGLFETLELEKEGT